MFLLLPIIIAIALAAGTYLLALVSEGFANELSRVIEAAFDFVEYRAALRHARKVSYTSREAHGSSIYDSLHTRAA